MRAVRFPMPMLALLAALLAGCATGPDPTQTRLDDLDARVVKLERVMNNGSLVQLAEQEDSLQGQVRDLQGRLDDLQRQNQQLRTRQRALYADLNRRLSALARGAAGPAAAGTAAESPAFTGDLPGVTATQQSVYAQAFEALKAGNYSVAVGGFKGFLKSYPTSPLAANAEYWLGEAHYVNQDYPAAEQAFRAVIRQWPQSNKTPDAMLDLGNTLIAQGKSRAGRATLEQVIKTYAGTDAAARAASQLEKHPAR